MKPIAEAYKDFPILTRTHRGKRIAYLDSGATTQIPVPVMKALETHMANHNGNPHRGAHVLAMEASEAYEGARDVVQRFINARKREEIIFTRNTTESLNLIAHSYGLKHVKEGDKIVITIAEHHANLVTWQYVCRVTGATLEYMYLDENGHIKDGEMDKIDESTKIVSFAHVSNVLGMEFPVKELVERAHAVGAIAILDGAQSAPHQAIDVQALDCDFFVFSGHKMCASQGIGVVYGKYHLLEDMDPFLFGGDMIEYVKELVRYVLPKLAAMPHIHVLGSANPEEKHGVIAFTVDDVHPHDVATIMDSHGVCLRSGHHCAQPLGAYYGVPASNRISMYIYTKKEDLDQFLEALKTVRPTMGLSE